MTTPTNPLAGPLNLAVGAGISATPESVSRRVDLLHQGGHGWMPADMAMALTTSDHSDNGMVQIADGIKSTLSSAWNGFSEAIDDPVLHKQPSTSLALARYLNASLGPMPVRQDDLRVIQQHL